MNQKNESISKGKRFVPKANYCALNVVKIIKIEVKKSGVSFVCPRRREKMIAEGFETLAENRV